MGGHAIWLAGLSHAAGLVDRPAEFGIATEAKRTRRGGGSVDIIARRPARGAMAMPIVMVLATAIAISIVVVLVVAVVAAMAMTMTIVLATAVVMAVAMGLATAIWV